MQTMLPKSRDKKYKIPPGKGVDIHDLLNSDEEKGGEWGVDYTPNSDAPNSDLDENFAEDAKEEVFHV